MANQTRVFPYGPVMPLVPAVLILLGLIFSFFQPYCRVYSIVSIVLGFVALFLVLSTACISFPKTSYVKGIMAFTSVLTAINLIMQGLCRYAWYNWTALAFWALATIVAIVFAAKPIEVAERSPTAPHQNERVGGGV